MSATFRSFSLNPNIVAPCVYKGARHHTTSFGAVLSSSVRAELRALLAQWLKIAGVAEPGTYCRIDAYPDHEGRLHILEGNWNFVDGWGTALNLARATGSVVTMAPAQGVPIHEFPRRWMTEEEVYLPELNLACDELAHGGIEDCHVVPWGSDTEKGVYLYGRSPLFRENRVFPLHGPRLDNKGLLIDLSIVWEGSEVRVPMTYGYEVETWEGLPGNVVFKPRCKSEASGPVRFRCDVGRGKDARRAFEAGETVAQEVVNRHLVDGRPTQFVIMCVGTEPLVGYVQYAETGTRVINDNSIHGPLLFADE